MKQPFAHLEPVMTFGEIAAELGVSRQYVLQVYKSAIFKLRRHMVQAAEMQAYLDSRRDYAQTAGRPTVETGVR